DNDGLDIGGVHGRHKNVPQSVFFSDEMVEYHPRDDPPPGWQLPAPPLLIPRGSGHLLTTYPSTVQPESAPRRTRSLRRVSCSSASGSEPGIRPLPAYSRAPSS